MLAGTALLLYGFGLSFNIMTLGGMAAAVGLIIDDAVVMLEHVMRRMEEGTAPDAPSRLAAAAQMHRPLLGSTLATMVVFLPLAFVTGVTGGFFKALAVTMVASLALSALYARVVIPLIAAHWLRDEDVAAARRAEQLTDRAVHAYERGAARVLARPGLAVCLVGIGGALLGWLAWNHVPSGFMPAMDEGGFVLDYKARPGAALTDTNRLLGPVEAIIAATPEVASYSRRTGAQLGGGLSEADEGDFFVRMKGGSRRDVEEVMAEIRQKIAAQVPGLEIELTQLMEDLIGDLTAVPQPVEVKLFSQDSAALDTAAGRVAKALGSIPGVVEIVDGQRVAGDAVALRIDAGAAAQAGLDARAVSDQVGALIGGVPATSVRIGEQLVTVRVRGAPELAARVAALARLPLVTPDGRSVTLGQIAQITVVAGQKQQTREDLAPLRRGYRAAGRDGPWHRDEGGARAGGRAAPARLDPGRLRRALCRTAEELCRPVARVRRRAAAHRAARDRTVRTAALDTRRARHRPAQRLRGAGGALGNRDRTQHFGADGADDGRGHGHRTFDLLPRRDRSRAPA